jgi:hypothetical protein
MEAIVTQPSSVSAIETNRTASCLYSVVGYNDLEARWVMLERDVTSAEHMHTARFISSEHLTTSATMVYGCDVATPDPTWTQRYMCMGHNGSIGIVLNQDLNFYFSVQPTPTTISCGVVKHTAPSIFNILSFCPLTSTRAISYSNTYGWIIEKTITTAMMWHNSDKFHCLFGVRPAGTCGDDITAKYVVGFRHEMFKFCFTMINGVDFMFRDNWDGDIEGCADLSEKRKRPYCIHLMNVELQQTRRYEYCGDDFGVFFDAQADEVFEKFDVYYQQVVLVTRRNFPGYKYKYNVYTVLFDDICWRFSLVLLTVVPFGCRYTANLLNIHFSAHCKKFVTLCKYFSSSERLMSFYSFEAGDNPSYSVTNLLCAGPVLNIAMPQSMLSPVNPSNSCNRNDSI